MKTKEKHGFVRENLATITEFFEGHTLWSQVWGLVLFALTIPVAIAAGMIAVCFCPESIATIPFTGSYVIGIGWFVTLACMFSTQQGKGYPYSPSKLERLFDDVIGFCIYFLLQVPGYVIWALSLVVAVLLLPITLLLDIAHTCPSEA